MGKTVKAHDTGKILDGKVFDSAIRLGKLIEFVFGWVCVIYGSVVGITLKNVGGKVVLTNPPNAILAFDVEMADVKYTKSPP